jgi:carbonic anhydrase
MDDERQKLIHGFKTFCDKYHRKSHVMQDLVKNGANPEFFIIHCIDARSGAGQVFHADPGELFGKRPMGAFVPPFAGDKVKDDMAASLSYAVAVKKVKHVIVMGHTQCGGIEALVKGTDDPAIRSWMSGAREAFARAFAKTRRGGDNTIEHLCRETEKEAVIVTLKNLLTYPCVKKAFEAGEITLNGWLFDMEHGDLLAYDPGRNSFESLTKVPGHKHDHKHDHDRHRGTGTGPSALQ